MVVKKILPVVVTLSAFTLTGCNQSGTNSASSINAASMQEIRFQATAREAFVFEVPSQFETMESNFTHGPGLDIKGDDVLLRLVYPEPGTVMDCTSRQECTSSQADIGEYKLRYKIFRSDNPLIRLDLALPDDGSTRYDYQALAQTDLQTANSTMAPPGTIQSITAMIYCKKRPGCEQMIGYLKKASIR